MIGAVVCICVLGLTTQTHAQAPSTANPKIETAPKPIRIQGLVTGRKKYSFTVKQDKTEYTVKLSAGAPVGLKMNKPWFDWNNDQVVVDAMSFSTGSDPASANPNKRVALKLPAKKLYLISRLGDAARMKETMAAEVKRLNFYLVTPNDPGQHFPTAEEPYLSGALSVNDNRVRVDVNEQMLPVILGFRYATMNGFSIVHLEPNKTQVFLSGVWADGQREIQATSVLFQPVIVAQAATSRPIGDAQGVAKQ
jgi:hypothetical protein